MHETTLHVLILAASPEHAQQLSTLLTPASEPAFAIETATWPCDLKPLSGLPFDAALLRIDNAAQITRFEWAELQQYFATLPVILIAPDTLVPQAEAQLEFGAVDCLAESELTTALLKRTLLLAQHATQLDPSPVTSLLRRSIMSLADDFFVVDRGFRMIINNRKALPSDEETPFAFPFCYTQEKEPGPCSWCRAKEVFENGQKATSTVHDDISGTSWEVTFTPLPDKSGRVTLVVVHKRDITHIVQAEEALRESETRYKTLADNIPDGVVLMFDHNLRNVVAAGGMLSSLGVTPRMVKGKRLREVLPVRIATDLEFFFRKALQGEQNWFAMKINGLFFDIHTLPVPAEEGSMAYGMAMAQHISPQREASIELAASHRRFRAIFENSRDGISIYEQKAHATTRQLIDCNDAYTKLAGRSRTTLKQYKNIGVLQEMPAMMRMHLHQQIENELPCSGTFSWLREDNSFNCMEFQAMPVREGDRVLVYEIIRDITDRARAEKELKDAHAKLEELVKERTSLLTHALATAQESKKRLDVILKSVADGLVVTDLENRIVMLNSRAEELLGIVHERNAPHNFVTLIDDMGCSPAILKALHTKVYPEEPFYIELTRNSIIRHIRVRLSAVQDSTDSQVGMVASMDDVTKEREVDKIKDEFISTAAHELRIPLTTIQGFSELMVSRENLSKQDMSRYSELIHNSAVTLSTIVTDLLDLSRIESGEGFAINKTETDMRDIIGTIAGTFSENHHTYSFTVDIPPEKILACFDPDKIGQVLTNLLSNAVKYSAPKTKVTVKLIADASWATITITDQGVGMTPEQSKRVFERFYRGHAAEGTVQGTGLGMSIAKYIVEKHGGRIWLESIQHVGTTVYVSIPRCCELR